MTDRNDRQEPAKTHWEPNSETVQIVQEYGHLLNNTGGNNPLDLLRQMHTERYLPSTNVVVWSLAMAVNAQVNLIKRLKEEGLL
jgi:hypothetical protein